MTSLRKITTSAALAVALLLQPTPANALDVTVGQPPEVGWSLLVDALSDGQLSASDLAGPAFQAFWSAASNVISRTNICREAYTEHGSGRVPPFTFYINMTVVSADGNSSVTYSHPVDVVALPRGVLGVGVRGSGTGYIKLFRCGDVGGIPENADDDAALARALAESRQFLQPLSHESRGGADSYILTNAHGRVIVHLPDDMAAGDTISGTVYIEPAGGGDAERRANTDTLSGYAVDVGGTPVRAAEGVFRIAVPASGLITLALSDGGTPLASQAIRAAPAVAAGVGQIEIPAATQAGRPASVPGPFDGDLSNTQVTVGGQPCPILAESPRQTVLASPDAPIGALPVQIRDGAHSAEGVVNNVGVSLTMPRTTLARGERTRVTLQVAGLQGIEQPVQVKPMGIADREPSGGQSADDHDQSRRRERSGRV